MVRTFSHSSIQPFPRFAHPLVSPIPSLHPHHRQYTKDLPYDVLFPVRPCLLDGVEFTCPHRLQAYLEMWYGVDCSLPRFRWNAASTAFVDAVSGQGMNNDMSDIGQQEDKGGPLILPTWNHSFHLQLAGTSLCVGARSSGASGDDASARVRLMVCDDAMPEQMARWVVKPRRAPPLGAAESKELALQKKIKRSPLCRLLNARKMQCKCAWMDSPKHFQRCPDGDRTDCYAECCCKHATAHLLKHALQPEFVLKMTADESSGKPLRKSMCLTRISSTVVGLRRCRENSLYLHREEAGGAGGKDQAIVQAQSFAFLPHGFVRIGGQCLAAGYVPLPDCFLPSDDCSCDEVYGTGTGAYDAANDDGSECFRRCTCHRARPTPAFAPIHLLPPSHSFVGGNLTLVDCALLHAHVKEYGAAGNEQGKTGVIFSVVD